ncbi:MAG: hypothetical protein LAO78_22625 [Acidobacteriia bacterium]|nr:hypothetical protein [Terriglobia bacterium]
MPPIGELFASDTGSSSSMQLAGSGMNVLSGSELSAGIAPATLKLFRGGQVRICPRSGLSVTANGQGLMLATGAGAVEVDYQLNQKVADVLITPDFNVMMVGPGTFHFALGVNKRGDTCVKPLPGNASEVTFTELLGTGVYKAQPNQSAVFQGGKLESPAALTSECGCPPGPPVVQAEAQPSPTPAPATENNTNAKPAERVAVASNEPTSPLPPDKPGQVHVQVDAPFVFSARSEPRPYSVAKVQFSSLPNVYFVQEKVDPVVLIEKQPEVSLKAEAQPPKPEEKPKKEKKGFMGRVKGFFGSLFHR